MSTKMYFPSFIACFRIAVNEVDLKSIEYAKDDIVNTLKNTVIINRRDLAGKIGITQEVCITNVLISRIILLSSLGAERADRTSDLTRAFTKTN